MTSPAPFVHLRIHSAYSLLEGAIHPKAIAMACRKLGMPAAAITDTDNLFGALEFSQACASLGVQPIIGCQIRVAQPDAGEAQRPRGTAAALDGGSLVLLVQNEEGYRNLIGLVSAAYMDSDESARPQLPLGAILARSAGLIALTGAVEGPLGRLLADGQQSQAEAMLADLKAGFPGRLYMELQRHGLALEARLEPQFLDLAYAHDVPLVATNEVYFLDVETYDAHDALLAVADGAFVSQSERRRLTPEHRLRSGEDMQALFAELPEAVANTLVIAQRTAFMVEPRPPILPAFPVADGRTVTQEIRAQSEAGLAQRLVHHVYPGIAEAERNACARPYRERLDYELGVIEGMGYAGYFLIVAEFIQWAKDNGIPVGPGRGSGAGSVVAWALKITDLDPLRWGLLFERFLNPERVSMPDFDVDFCQ
ncbi:MAG: PHP domain-containing protein, partial [Proteobacteria bacterium]|nr:PHP domain-containing protein [Pseudomonadota bacterium]